MPRNEKNNRQQTKQFDDRPTIQSDNVCNGKCGSPNEKIKQRLVKCKSRRAIAEENEEGIDIPFAGKCEASPEPASDCVLVDLEEDSVMAAVQRNNDKITEIGNEVKELRNIIDELVEIL